MAERAEVTAGWVQRVKTRAPGVNVLHVLGLHGERGAIEVETGPVMPRRGDLVEANSALCPSYAGAVRATSGLEMRIVRGTV